MLRFALVLNLYQIVPGVRSGTGPLVMRGHISVHLRAYSGGGMLWTVSSCMSYRLPAG